MKIEINSKYLATQLGALMNVIERRATIPALSNVLIESDGKGLRLTATDLDNTLEIEVEPMSVTKGKLYVSLEKLFNLVKTIPEQEISVNGLDNNWAELITERGRYKIGGISSESYPFIQTANGMSYEFEGKDFLLGLSKVKHHVGIEEHSRWETRSALFELNGSLRFVACNGHCLSLCEISPEQPFLKSDSPLSWMLPAKAVRSLPAILNETEKVLIYSNDNLISFKQGTKKYTTRRPTQPFFNYQMAMGSAPPLEAEIDRDTLSIALNTVSTIAEANSMREKAVKFTFANNALTLTSTTTDGEEATEEMDCKLDAELTIGFDINKLKPMLAAASKDAKFRLGKDKPMFIISDGERIKSTQLIMPYRT